MRMWYLTHVQVEGRACAKHGAKRATSRCVAKDTANDMMATRRSTNQDCLVVSPVMYNATHPRPPASSAVLYLLARVPAQVECPVGRLGALRLGKLDVHETLCIKRWRGRC